MPKRMKVPKGFRVQGLGSLGSRVYGLRFRGEEAEGPAISITSGACIVVNPAKKSING